MKVIRRIFDGLVVLAASVLLGMLAYQQIGGMRLPARLVPWTEVGMVALFLLTVILNTPHYWRSVKLLIFGMLPLLALIVSVVLPQYFHREVPTVANVLFYFYLLYWHLFLAVREGTLDEPAAPEPPPVPATRTHTARRAVKPAAPTK